jgi:hypothetical protein
MNGTFASLQCASTAPPPSSARISGTFTFPCAARCHLHLPPVQVLGTCTFPSAVAGHSFVLSSCRSAPRLRDRARCLSGARGM